jgi:transposase
MDQDLFIGIDVSKDFLDVAIGGSGQVQRLTNDEPGLKQLQDALRDHNVKLIVMEATGGFHRLALATLLQRGLPTVAINPRQARDFAKALGLLEKNDRIDAKALQLFAERVRPPVRALPDQETQAFDELLTRRRQIIEMLIAEKNRASHAQTARVRKNIQEHVDWLKKQLRDTDKELKELVESCPAWNAKVELLEAIKGIGTVTAATLLSAIPELGTLNRKQVAKLAGLAPLCCDSGRQTGKRKAWGGRADARTALYMPTITAVRHNPDLRSFYQRLVAAGKPKKVALVAAMRKLLTIINAVVREHLLLQTPAQAT